MRTTGGGGGGRERAHTVLFLAPVALSASCFLAAPAFGQSWALPGQPGISTGGVGFGTGLPAPGQPLGQGQGWRVQPGIRVQGTYTDNVNLAASPNSRKDFVTEVAPRLTVFGGTPRLQVSGFVQATGLLYANVHENNRTVPSANLTGRAELWERLVYLDAAALATQTYQSFLGGQPTSLSNVSENRVNAYRYSLSPFLQRTFGGGTSVLLRNDNIWAQGSGSSSIGGTSRLADSYTQNWTGNVDVPIGRYGLGGSYNRSSIEFKGQRPLSTEIGRARVWWRPDPTLYAYATGGAESNNYAVGDRSGPTYGGGGRWLPTDRTTIFGDWEHRFFGSSYSYGLSHRLRWAVWDVRASKGLNTFPQLLGGAQPVSLASQLDASLASTIPDVNQRQQAVNQLLLQLGLPGSFIVPLSFFTQQVFIFQREETTLTLLGARNTLGFTLFRTRSDAITNEQSTSTVLGSQNIRQWGGSLTWSYRLNAQSSFNWTITRVLSEITSLTSGGTGDTAQTLHRLLYQHSVSPRTNAFVGLRHNYFTTTIGLPYRENAVFAGFDHRF